jgi:HEAT repeat protein
LVDCAIDKMSHYKEINRLLSGEAIGCLNGRQIIRDLTSEEYGILLSLLSHKKTRLRWSAAARLGKIGNSRATEPLINALQDSNWLVRLHAARALGYLEQPISIEPLIKMMNDECPYVRRRVVIALRQLNSNKDDRITETLISALSDSDKFVRAHAAWELREIVSPASIAAIALAVRDHDTNVSWRAINALQKIGVPSVMALINLLKCQDSKVRYRAVKALGNIGDQRAIKPLETMVDDAEEEVRQRALFALRQIEFRSVQKKLSRVEKVTKLWQKLWKRG